MKYSSPISRAIAILTLLSLLGCNKANKTNTPVSTTNPPVNTGQGKLVTYQCQNNATFTARLSDQVAIVDLPNNPNLPLSKVQSGSGAKYSDGTTTLWDKGGEAFVESNGDMLFTNCQANQATANTNTPTPTETPNTSPPNNNQQDNTTANQSDSRIRTERVQFRAGANNAVVENSITGYEIRDYILGASAGQYMNVSMTTNNTANYFNILAPGENEVAMFNGSTSQNQYEGTLSQSGDYKIRVYMMRSAARQNEVANYRLEMIISSPKNSSPPPSTPQPSSPPPSTPSNKNDAKIPGTNFNAKGNIPCAMTQTEANGSCAFRVLREGNGNGFMEVTTQYGKTFSIYFQNGEVVGAEGGSGAFSKTRSGDQTVVDIGEERYTIPDAVISGG